MKKLSDYLTREEMMALQQAAMMIMQGSLAMTGLGRDLQACPVMTHATREREAERKVA